MGTEELVPTSYHLSVAAVHAAAQPGQLHTAASAARAADQDWRRISGSYAGAAAPQPDSSQSANSGAAVHDFTPATAETSNAISLEHGPLNTAAKTGRTLHTGANDCRVSAFVTVLSQRHQRTPTFPAPSKTSRVLSRTGAVNPRGNDPCHATIASPGALARPTRGASQRECRGFGHQRRRRCAGRHGGGPYYR
jgi:hypothetical protein